MNTNKGFLKFGVLSIFILSLFCLDVDAAHAQYRRSSSRDNWSSYSRSESSSLRRKINQLDDDAVDELKVPILFGIAPYQLFDSWGDARSSGRTHEGTDIMAPRRAFIVSPTDAVVTEIADSGNGGIHVYTANPGGERFYFAHLDEVAEDLDEGDVLEPGDFIGYVGNTGNASGGATHLHFGVYDDDHDAENPFPRLTEEFSLKDKIESLEKIIDNADDEDEVVAFAIANYRTILLQARAQGIDLPDEIAEELAKLPASVITAVTDRLLYMGLSGEDVRKLQTALIAANTAKAARELKEDGRMGYFDALTKSALIEYQAANGLTADGLAGARTKASLRTKGYSI